MDRVLVQKIKPVAKTASGLYIPEKAQSSLNRGKVLSVGPGALDRDGKRIPMNVTVGDTVVLPAFSGTAIKDESAAASASSASAEQELFIYRDSELLAKLNEWVDLKF